LGNLSVEDNVKTDAKDIGFEDADCVHLVQDKVQWLLLVDMKDFHKRCGMY
jgi:hypothetical protein